MCACVRACVCIYTSWHQLAKHGIYNITESGNLYIWFWKKINSHKYITDIEVNNLVSRRAIDDFQVIQTYLKDMFE